MKILIIGATGTIGKRTNVHGGYCSRMVRHFGMTK